MWHDVLFSARHSRTERSGVKNLGQNRAQGLITKGKNCAFDQNRFFASLRMTNKVGAYNGYLIACDLFWEFWENYENYDKQQRFLFFLYAVCPLRTLSSPINVGKQQPRRYTRDQKPLNLLTPWNLLNSQPLKLWNQLFYYLCKSNKKTDRNNV